MNTLAFNERIIGQSFDHWQDLYDKGNIENHIIYLRLAHLKYAIDQNFITSQEYYVHRMGITNQFKKSFTGYKPCLLIDFCKALKLHKSTSKCGVKTVEQEIICHVPANIKKASEIIEQQNELLANSDYSNQAKNEESKTYETIILKTPLKKRKKKKRYNSNNCRSITYDHLNNLNAEVTVNDNNKCHKKIDPPENAVKIFESPINNMNKSKILDDESLISTKKSARQIFSNILKQFKKERQVHY